MSTMQELKQRTQAEVPSIKYHAMCGADEESFQLDFKLLRKNNGQTFQQFPMKIKPCRTH